MYKLGIAGLTFNLAAFAASIGGTVFDPSGAVIPQAHVTLWNPLAAGEQTTVTTASGEFSFPDLAAGQFLLRVEKPGFASAYKAFTVQVDSAVQRSVVMRMGSVEETVRVPATGPSQNFSAPGAMPPKRLRIGGNVQASQITHKAQPVYPAAAKAAGVQGAVLIGAIIQKDGTIGELTVISSPSDDLSAASLDAVRQWTYKPTLLNGDPVELETTINVNFTLAP